MIEFSGGPIYWHWLSFAAAVFCVRTLMPFGMAYTLGRGVMVLGLTAAVMGLALFAEPGLTGLQQMGLAAVASLAVAYGLNWWGARANRSTRAELPPPGFAEYQTREIAVVADSARRLDRGRNLGDRAQQPPGAKQAGERPGHADPILNRHHETFGAEHRPDDFGGAGHVPELDAK